MIRRNGDTDIRAVERAVKSDPYNEVALEGRLGRGRKSSDGHES